MHLKAMPPFSKYSSVMFPSDSGIRFFSHLSPRIVPVLQSAIAQSLRIGTHISLLVGFPEMIQCGVEGPSSTWTPLCSGALEGKEIAGVSWWWMLISGTFFLMTIILPPPARAREKKAGDHYDSLGSQRESGECVAFLLSATEWTYYWRNPLELKASENKTLICFVFLHFRKYTNMMKVIFKSIRKIKCNGTRWLLWKFLPCFACVLENFSYCDVTPVFEWRALSSHQLAVSCPDELKGAGWARLRCHWKCGARELCKLRMLLIPNPEIPRIGQNLLLKLEG